MKHTAFQTFLVLAICVNNIYVSGQYKTYNNNNGFQPITERQIDDDTTATQTEYEYYDEYEDYSTPSATSIPTTIRTTTTTTTTTTTPKPPQTSSSYRFLTTRRNGIRTTTPSANKAKFGVNRQPSFYGDSYTEASVENAIVQYQQPTKGKQSSVAVPSPHLRNAIVDVDRRANGKEYAQEKSATSIESNGNNFSRRYARFLFKQRSG